MKIRVLQVKDHGHILTGDLKIIDNKLRTFHTQVPKYKESISANFKGTRSDLILSLNTCTGNWLTQNFGAN